MTNRKTTRRALVLSLLSLLLCCSMLVGTTFAWFTDSVTSGNNKIIAGNLDVEVYYGDPAAKNSIEKVNTLFNEVTLWEPGVVAYENLTVVNEGTLALKYQMAVNFTNENTVNGYGLSQILKVGVVAGGIADNSTREQAVAAVTQWQPMESFTWNGELAAKTADETVGLVIYWEPSSDDNNWNVNNGKTTSDGEALHIDLGIELFATQLMAESDSFGNDYDGAATWTGGVDTDWYFEDPEAAEFVIYSAEELAGLAALVNGTATAPVTTYAADVADTVQDDFKGQTIKLGGNIDLKGQSWSPIGNVTFDRANSGSYVVKAAFKGTFDGQDHTVYNLQIANPAANGVGLFGAAVGATIKNVNVKNVDIVADGTAAAIVGYTYSYSETSVIDNCHVSGKISIVTDWAYVGGIVAYGHANITKCSVIADGTGVMTSKNRNAVGGIMGWNYGAFINDCQVKNLDLTGWANVAGVVGYVPGGHTISGCAVENVTLTKTRQDGHPTIGLASGGWSYNASMAITVANNSFKNITLNGNYVAIESADILYGAEYAGGKNTNFVLENNTQENITNNLIEVSKNPEGFVLDTEGNYLIGDATAFALMEAQADGYFADKTIKLTANIDFGGATLPAVKFWSPGNQTTFDGNGKTLSNFAISDTNGNAGLFAGTFDVKNLNIERAEVTGKYVGVLAGNMYGNIDNCTVKGSTINGTYWQTGALCGQYNSGNITNCVVEDCTINGKAAVGGLVGILNESAGVRKIENCTVKACDIVQTGSFGGNYDEMFAAAVGCINISNAQVYFTDCTVEGNTVKGVASNSLVGEANSSTTVYVNNNIGVASAEALKGALNAATGNSSIALLRDIAGDVTVAQKPDVSITIDGKGNTFAGVITVDGKSATYLTAGLTIKDLTFKADSISADACIRLGNGTNDTRYTTNVTVSNCTFDVPGAVGIKSYTGGDKNLTVTGCTAAAGTHSLIQAKGIDGILIEGCKVYSKNGLNFNNSTNVTVSGCTVDTKGYAVRFGESSGGSGAAETYLIKGCTLKSACEEGDAVIILRGTADNSTLTIENTTLEGTTKITNTATNAKVIEK